MPSVVARLLLFISSYFPLACIFAVLFWQNARLFAVVVLAIGIVGLCAMLLFLRAARQLTSIDLVVSDARRSDAEAMSYLVTYVIPFLALPSESAERITGLAVFFGVLCILYVNSNMIHINPMLNLFGYRLYEVATNDGCMSLITRKRVVRDRAIAVVEIGEAIYLEK